MNVDTSSVAQSLYAQGTGSRSSVQKTADDETASSSSTSRYMDTVTISDEARSMLSGSKMPPPPEEMDFDSMSDDEVVSYVKQMQEATGKVPGMDDDASLDDLTSEQIANLRTTLNDMAANPPEKGQGPGGPGGPRGAGGPQGGPPPAPPEETDVNEMSDEELLEYLEKMQEMTGGNIPGMEEGVSVSSLTEDNLSTVRSALKAMAGGE